MISWKVYEGIMSTKNIHIIYFPYVIWALHKHISTNDIIQKDNCHHSIEIRFCYMYIITYRLMYTHDMVKYDWVKISLKKGEKPSSLSSWHIIYL